MDAFRYVRAQFVQSRTFLEIEMGKREGGRRWLTQTQKIADISPGRGGGDASPQENLGVGQGRETKDASGRHFRDSRDLLSRLNGGSSEGHGMVPDGSWGWGIPCSNDETAVLFYA